MYISYVWLLQSKAESKRIDLLFKEMECFSYAVTT